jgi:hypothetical protein
MYVEEPYGWSYSSSAAWLLHVGKLPWSENLGVACRLTEEDRITESHASRVRSPSASKPAKSRRVFTLANGVIRYAGWL